MNKTPISVALERQIPEYIRGEYELFVNFIKAYYEFLDQTQQRDLEDIRSISNTLDEFVIRFKKELSVLFPTNTLANERFILERIREFYKARGSKESYQFLFKALFNKDADIFYPSTQILRASDGKWIQEKSVFVEYGDGNLFNLSGKIIQIKTAQKTINVFCTRVVYYRANIYEVFIERAYTQDISIGDEVSSSDENDFGSILPCPAKYTITSEGSGFEVGKLYNLKTESGDGSIIKITKIGTNGSIKKIQIISFGLDYKSTFYAKLSNKSLTAFPYRHPIPGPYPDGTNGFVDYGYINKQDYFYYDKFYTPAGNTAEKVFYADGTYVGEIIGSFYTNSSNTNVIDSSAAEIKIELGAVAIYPGYYEASDGFISDSCFIQDGKYYQLFSYVIKVEQQIDSYYDIVKELLHPAGLNLFAEYNIKNQYLVSATPLQAFIRRQFLEQEFVTDDESANLVYKPANDYSTSTHNFLNDIKDVAPLKQDYLAPITFNYYDMDKIIVSNDSLYSTTDFRYNDISQPKADLLDSPIDGITNKDVEALKADSQIADSESGIRFWNITSAINGTFYQTLSTSDFAYNDVSQPKADLLDSPTDFRYNEIAQSKSDFQSTDEDLYAWEFTSTIDGTFYQTSSTSDSAYNDVSKVSSDLTGVPSDSAYNDVSKVSSDLTGVPFDSFDRTVTYDRSINDLNSSIDVLYNNLSQDTAKDSVEAGFEDVYIYRNRLLDDVINLADSFDRTATYYRSINDTFIADEVPYKTPQLSQSELYSVSDSVLIANGYVRLFDDAINNINNTGLLYYNAYNQNNALDATTSYSYEAETYSVRSTSAIS
jgi:hypothetical protein